MYVCIHNLSKFYAGVQIKTEVQKLSQFFSDLYNIKKFFPGQSVQEFYSKIVGGYFLMLWFQLLNLL